MYKTLLLLSLFTLSSAHTRPELIDYVYNKATSVIPENGVDLELSIAIRAFNNIDQKEGIVSLNLWLRYRWNDFHLRWNESEWNNVTSVTLRTDPQIENRII